ncbi:MAG: hypothetical protein ACPG4T_07335 [Nannocystaceae bacterium]
MNLSSCYGPGLGDLVDIVGNVDVTSKTSVNTFAAEQWRRLGSALGFGDLIEPGLRGSLASNGQLGSVVGVAIRAVREHLRDVKQENAPASFAQARYATLHDASSSQRGWGLALDLSKVPNGGCIDGVRAFPAVNRETYFHPQRNPSLTPRDCYWPTIYPVFVGTWPWVYGHALTDQPASLAWSRSADTDPVALCAQLYAASWTLAGNASIDARLVYAHYEQFKKSTAPLTEALPKEPTKPRAVYRGDQGLLRVYMAEPSTEHLNGTLGPISVKAYNHILSSFAAFFRVRSEIMSHHKNLPASVQSILDQNPDPCIVNLRKPGPKPPGDKLSL